MSSDVGQSVESDGSPMDRGGLSTERLLTRLDRRLRQRGAGQIDDMALAAEVLRDVFSIEQRAQERVRVSKGTGEAVERSTVTYLVLTEQGGLW